MADFLAMQVATGYMHGLATIIFIGQLPTALSIKISSGQPIPQLLEAVKRASEANWITLTIAAFCVAVILCFQRWIPRIPGQIVAIVLSTAAVGLFHLEGLGVSVVGHIPSGIPHLRVPLVSAGDCASLLPIALAGALLAFSDTMVTARAFASRNHYQIDANQEMLALGMASISSGFSQALPLSSSGSRTAVAESAGSRTQVTSVVAAAVVAAALTFLTPAFRELPNAALAGVLMAAAYNLCDFGEWRRIWRFRGIGFAAAAFTLLGMLALGVMQGIAIGVLFCIVMLLKAIAFPEDAVLGRLTTTGGFGDVARHADARQIAGVLLYRFSGPLIFANCSRFSARVEELVEAGHPLPRHLIVDASGILFIDLSGCETLIQLVRKLQDQGVTLGLANVHGALADSLAKGGVIEVLGQSAIFPTFANAVESVEHVSAAPLARGV
jgi:MFS superfamily sulfate permease-like transporter